jgi:poly-beta-1,6-N-acetyl-D-glucosamine synthase
MKQFPAGTYVVISPAKDEEAYIEQCVQSMVKQTIPPLKWVIVDDGSCDRTLSIIESYANQYNWIVPVVTDRNLERLPGAGVMRAFYRGYEKVRRTQFDLIVKMDVDLDLPPDYFERLLNQFAMDANLGIASGIYLEPQNEGWSPVPMPEYHAAGASKVLRRECFDQIGGFVIQSGWDTVDEIKAQLAGWRTKHFTDIEFHHLRPEGSAIGVLRTSANYGGIYYACGGGALFFLLKVAHRFVFGKPIFCGALAMLYGYLRSRIKGRKRLVSKAEASAYRHMLNDRIRGRVARLFPLMRSN